MARIFFVLVVLALPSLAVGAPVMSPVVNRDYDIDLHVGAARGSPRIVAMGGTTTALVEGAGGLIGNPGAIAVRPLASRDRWDWDAYLSGFAPNLGSDFDNNGVRSDERLNADLSGVGILGFFGPWALGLGVESVNYALTAPATMPMSAAGNGQIDSTLARLVFGRSFAEGALALGGSLRIGEFAILEAAKSVFSVSGLAVEGGLLLSPRGTDWRSGLRVSLPVRATAIAAQCDPSNCRGFMLPTRAVAPWEVALGAARRFGPGTWNEAPLGRFRDEASLTVAAEVVLTGPLARASGLEAFLARQLQRSGQATTVSVRIGLEREWLPGRLRVQAGSYWEPARFEGVSGRAHLTAGGELRLFSFHFWDAERRIALAVAADAGPRYGNAGISIGSWH